jgi:DNA-binding MarR family transcriptional regulator
MSLADDIPLTKFQRWTLEELAQYDDAHCPDTMKTLGCERTNYKRTMEILVRKGLASREPQAAGVVFYRITPLGYARLANNPRITTHDQYEDRHYTPAPDPKQSRRRMSSGRKKRPSRKADGCLGCLIILTVLILLGYWTSR